MDEASSYHDKLKAIFDSFDEWDRGYLCEDQLLSLCQTLNLEDHSSELINKLLSRTTKITFDCFEEVFVTWLSTDLGVPQEPSISEREVSPKFVLGEKEYGRKSKPSISDLNIENNDNAQEEDPIKTLESQLRTILQKVGLEDNQYLSVEDLASVCLHIGITDEVVVENLFESLDPNQDGKMKVDDLLQVLAQYSSSYTNNTSLGNEKDNLPNDEIKSPPSSEGNSISPVKVISSPSYEDTTLPIDELNISSLSEDKTPLSKNTPLHPFYLYENMIFIFPKLSNTGRCSSIELLEYWESIGLIDGHLVLEKLGLSESTIDLTVLAQLLEEELSTFQCSNLVHYFALSSLLHQHKLIRTNYEQMELECDILRNNLSEANDRANLLALEVDEQHAHYEKSSVQKLESLEKKYQDKVKELSLELQTEKDSLAAQLSIWSKGALVLKEEQNALNNKSIAQEKEITKITQELQEYQGKLHHSQSTIQRLEQERESFITSMKKQLKELEFSRTEKESRQLIQNQLNEQIHKNKHLQDLVDELNQELAVFRSKPANEKSPHSITWIEDYITSQDSNASYEDELDCEPLIKELKNPEERPMLSHVLDSYNPGPATSQLCATLIELLDGKGSSQDIIQGLQLIEHNYAINHDQLLQLNKTVNSLETECSFLKARLAAKQLPSKQDILLKDLYVENASLMKQLAISESLERESEQSNKRLQHKCHILSKMLAEVTKILTS